MTNNIAARLRAFEAWLRDPRGEPLMLTSDLFDEAADEIERLRAALREAMDDTPGWYDIARAALAGGNDA